MSMTENLFGAQVAVTPISATASAPGSATVLANIGNTARIVNESTIAAFIAFGTSVSDTAAIATLPTAGSKTSCYVAPGADFTVAIPGSVQMYASAITRSGTATLQIYVGEGG